MKWDYQPTSIEGVPELRAGVLRDDDGAAAGPSTCATTLSCRNCRSKRTPLPPADAHTRAAHAGPGCARDRRPAARGREPGAHMNTSAGGRAGSKVWSSSPKRLARPSGTSRARSTSRTGIRFRSAWTRTCSGRRIWWSVSTSGTGRSRRTSSTAPCGRSNASCPRAPTGSRSASARST